MHFLMGSSSYFEILPLLFFLFFINSIHCSVEKRQKIFEHNLREADREHWNLQAQETLHASLLIRQNENVAKNIIFFMGDGMGISTVTAGRIYKGQLSGRSGEEENLEFDKFPHVALLKTYNVNTQVPDSASTATALFCGVKTNYKVVGVDGRTILKDCNSSIGAEVQSILAFAIGAGKETGFVTTTRVTHASPSALYAHAAFRDWESDNRMPANASYCKDIARQLIEDFPGKNIKVILGGGRGNFLPNTKTDHKENKAGLRKDGLDLIDEWKLDKKSRNRTYRFMSTKHTFDEWDPSQEEYVMGLFNFSHLSFDSNRADSDYNYSVAAEPSIVEMTEKAIRRLQRSDNGFFLFVEGGRIDQAHHAGLVRYSLEETVAMDKAVKTAIQLTNEEDTLIIVTADHSHPMTINGYPGRGTPILGTAGYSKIDKMPYTTLMYTNGVGYAHNGVIRANLSAVDTQNKAFTSQVAVPMAYATHSGEDVAVFARGPMSHLFQGVKEQNYIAHALGYAACMGYNLDHCKMKSSKGSIMLRPYNSEPRQPRFVRNNDDSNSQSDRLDSYSNAVASRAQYAFLTLCISLHLLASLL